jgi:hypothetical protein
MRLAAFQRVEDNLAAAAIFAHEAAARQAAAITLN